MPSFTASSITSCPESLLIGLLPFCYPIRWDAIEQAGTAALWSARFRPENIDQMARDGIRRALAVCDPSSLLLPLCLNSKIAPYVSHAVVHPLNMFTER